MEKEKFKKLYEELYSINVNQYVEQKNGLNYLSWAYAISEICKRYNEEFSYKILKFENNLPYVYDENTGYMVFTEITLCGQTREMWLPVMDNNNKAMLKEQYEYATRTGKKTVEKATMFDINKTIMRCLVKNLAMFGLGMYIYAGEDLPEEEKKEKETPKKCSAEQVARIRELGVIEKNVCIKFKIASVEELTEEQANYVIETKEKSIKKGV